MIFDVVYTAGEFYVMNNSEIHGPYYYASEAQEKADELNENKD